MDETERNEAPVEEAPIEEAPAEEAPAEEVPAEEAPTEEAPAEEAPAEEVPTEEAPAEEAPAGDAPAGEAPAESGMDGITLGVRLCEAVLEAVGRDGFHGGIRPDNISVSRESVSLGSPLLHGVGEFTPQELEYMAPELFWDGVRKPAGDVYSLGMVLYGIYNGGRMPFWPEEGDATPNLRAGALQRRMSREEIPAPSQAGAELSAIILRALAFSEEERWHDTEELRNALSDCEERQEPAADIAAVVAGLSAGGAAPLRVAPARKSRPEPEEDELSSPFVEDADAPDYENEPIPRRRVRRSNRRLAQIIVYSVLIIAIAAAIFLLSRCTRLGPAAVTPTPVVAATLPPDDAVIVIDGNQTAGEATPAPAATPEPTPEPTPAPGVVTYTAYAENVSWSEAKARCLEMGGELAMPQNYAEFVEITKVCEDAGLTYVWLGARRDESGTWVTAAGEPASFFAWGDGEPSGQDTDGTPEDYYLLWNLGDRWSGNDSRENPLDGYWGVYAGKIGFVCKTVTYPEAAPAEPAPEEPAV